MGIKNLYQVLEDNAPGSIKAKTLTNYKTKVIGFDASTLMYQFLHSMTNSTTFDVTQLTDNEGNLTGHLLGLFNKAAMLLENGIKPVFVFDGKPPVLKSGELAIRRLRREKAKELLEEAKEIGTGEDIRKQMSRQISITRQMKEEAMELLKMLGLPVVQAPSEAEAQIVHMLKQNKIFAVASEDMDCLTFGAKIMLKGLKSTKEPIHEIDLNTALKELDMDMETFINFCILCGCDYTKSIKNLGPKKSLALIKEFKTIDNILEELNNRNNVIQAENIKIQIKEGKLKKKFEIPNQNDFPYKEAYDLFVNPNITNDYTIKFTKPDEEAVINFLVNKKNFNIEKVKNNLERCKKADLTKTQTALTMFFTQSDSKPKTTAINKSSKKISKKK